MRQRENEATWFAFCMTAMACLLALSALCNLACGANTGLYSFEQECQTGTCPLTAGPASCVCVGATDKGYYVVLTASHCCDQTGNRFFAVGNKGKRYGLTLAKRDRDADVAVLISRVRLSATAVSFRIPAEGTQAELVGVLSRRVMKARGVVDKRQGRRLRLRKFWSHPGMSGAGYYSPAGQLIGIHHSKVVGTDETYAASGEAIRALLQQIERSYGRLIQQQQATANCAVCPPQQYRTAPSSPRQPSVIAGGCSVVVDYEKLADRFMQRYGSQLRGANGRDGTDGEDGRNGASPELDLNRLAAVIVDRYGEQLRGPQGPAGNDGIGQRGQRGEQGPQGLVGVPDSNDIRNWLVGAMSDPETKQQLAVLLADLVATDPRVEGLIQRLEALENRQASPVAGETGPPGPAGTVNVVIKDSGRTVNRHDQLASGSTVEVDITRFTKKEK